MNTETTIDLSSMDVYERAAIAERSDLPQALVDRLADDPDGAVRRAVQQRQGGIA
jgi:hypothetical protein